MTIKIFSLAVVIGLACSGPAMAQWQEAGPGPRWRTDAAKKRVLEVANLYPQFRADGCHDMGRIEGKVVDREFDGAIVSLFTIEERSGERTSINVIGEALENASMVTRGYVIPALQTKLRVGNRVSVGIVACGAAGRVMYANSIR